MLVLLRTNQVAAMLAVSANTVRNWADQNLLPVHSRTAGGHRQFALGDVRRVEYFNDHLHEGRDRIRSDHGFVRALLRVKLPPPAA